MKIYLFKDKPGEKNQEGKPFARFKVRLMRYAFSFRITPYMLVISWWYDKWLNSLIEYCKTITWLQVVNVVLLQWFFVRLTRCRGRLIQDVTPTEFSMMPDGTVGMGFSFSGQQDVQWWSIQYWVVPCTGWWNGFRYLSGPYYWQLTKKKILRKIL